ncbi:MAG TPA: HNH endonuclease signature motif containing protein [Polyangiales bacterium]|nr:HNH endonuclease signature motif containing protein [Polyangiales bacterium]
MDLGAVARLDDVALMVGLQRLVRQDRALTARLLLHLGEVEARGLYREQAFSSMFEYAVEALRMSDAEAYVRLRAAKIAREFPLILQMLDRNELHLTAVKLLAPHLTQANHVEVLERARARTKREVEKLVAELAPKPDVPSVVRKLPSARPAARVVPPPEVGPAPAELPVRELRLEAPAQTQWTTPLSPGRYKVQFTATQVLHDKLQQLKDLMRHQIPDGDLCVIFERAADLLIEQQTKRRFAQTAKPRSAAPDAAREAAHRRRSPQTEQPRSAAPDAAREAAHVRGRSPQTAKASSSALDTAGEAASWSRYVPRAVVREVYARDSGQCAFVSPASQRCRARDQIELHHEDPFARGGAPTVENLRLLCHTHNALLAEQDFGRAYIEGKRRQSSPRNRINRVPSRIHATGSSADRQASDTSASAEIFRSGTCVNRDHDSASRRNQASTANRVEFTQLHPSPTDKLLKLSERQGDLLPRSQSYADAKATDRESEGRRSSVRLAAASRRPPTYRAARPGPTPEASRTALTQYLALRHRRTARRSRAPRRKRAALRTPPPSKALTT